MSADRWSKCPKCKNTPKESDLMYGKIPLADYVKLIEQENEKGKADKQTLREDWDIYWDKDDNLHISYGCLCSACGFSMSINETKPMKGGAE